MRRLRWTGILLAVFLTVSLTLGPTASAGDGSNSNADPPERLLVFTIGDDATNNNVKGKSSKHGGAVVDEVYVRPGLHLLVAEVPHGKGGDAKKDLRETEGVREVAPDIAPKALDDPLSWGVDRIDAEFVWAREADRTAGIGAENRRVHEASGTNTGDGVVIGILDTGVRLDQPDLKNNLSGQPHADCTRSTRAGECLTGGKNGSDNDGHGTWVAGIAAARHNDSLVIGVAPRARLLSVKVLSPGTFSSVVKGIRYAAGRNKDGVKKANLRAHVINGSFGWSKVDLDPFPTLIEALQQVVNEYWGDGGVYIAAAGNEGNAEGIGDSVGYPARLANVVAVAATDKEDKRAFFSSTGSPVDIAAPGVNIRSLCNSNSTSIVCVGSGTSASAPHVAGVAALVRASGVTGNGDIVSRLLSTADPLGDPNHFGAGLVDAQEAATLSASTP